MSALTVAEVLDGAADLLTPEGKWTQEQFARDNTGGTYAHGFDQRATCWCVVGAIEKVRHAVALQPGYKDPAVLFLERGIGYVVTEWNDEPNRTQDEVVEKLRQAAALAREQQA